MLYPRSGDTLRFGIKRILCAIMSVPDFLIAGAPKCGTTTLYEALRRHPQIYMPAVKEPHFFSPDLSSPNYMVNLREYLSIFESARSDQITGEASVYYLYSAVAAERIRRHNPSARIIVMLRNPADMIDSLHSQALYNCDEDLEDLREALAAEEDRKCGRRIPLTARLPHTLCYRAIADYAPQVKRFLDVFGRGQVHVILFDDLAADPQRVFTACLLFLGVDQTVRMQTEWANPNTRLRSAALERLVKKRTLVRGMVKRSAPRLYSALFRAFHRANTVAVPRPVMDPGLRAQLRDEFASGLEDLGRLIGRDLSPWTQDTAQTDTAPAGGRTMDTGGAAHGWGR